MTSDADEPELEFPSYRDFWSLVALAREDISAFEARLGQMSAPALGGFAHVFFALESELSEFSRELISSEDAADDLCGWIVAQGLDFLRTVLGEPDTVRGELVARFDADSGGPGIDIRYAATERYEELTGEMLEEYVDCLFFIEDFPEFHALVEGAEPPP